MQTTLTISALNQMYILKTAFIPSKEDTEDTKKTHFFILFRRAVDNALE